jgi:hypothetical protein
MSSSKNIKWDESQSPQWRYLLSQESRARKGLLRKKKSIEEITGEGEIKRNKQSVRASHKKRKDRMPSLGLTKKGRKIIYSASPGHGRYTNSNTTPPTTTNQNNNNNNDNETTRLPTGTEEQE